MTSRPRRHRRIRELVTERPVPSQAALRDLLAAEGLGVTQATLSRDLRELGLVKGPGGYRLPGAVPPRAGRRDLERILEAELISAECGGTTVVLRTRPGHADALAIEIDRARPPEVLGTIAGDDTVFVAAATPRQAQSLLRRVRAIAGQTESAARAPHRRKRSQA